MENNKTLPLKPLANILLVDDSPANLLVLRTILDELGQNLVEVLSGDAALEKVQADDFAAVLLDVHMPGLSGFETAMLIRAQSRSRRTPIIFLTARDIDRSDLEQGYLLGAVDFLVKPFAPLTLRAKINSFVELFEEKQIARREAQQLRLLIDGTYEYALIMLDPDGIVITWNPGAQRIVQFRASEIVGQHFSRFYTPDAIERGWPARQLQSARTEGRFEDMGWRVRKDGTQFWANVVITALRDEAGILRGFSKITRDMTEQKRAEENARRLLEEEAARRAAEANAQLIQEHRERLQVTLASIGDAVISTDAEGRITFLNPIAEKLTAWTQANAKGKPLIDVFNIVNEQTRQPVENPAKRALKEGVIVGLANHTILIAKDGVERPIDDSAAPIRDTAGRTIGAVLVFRDITEKMRQERHRSARVAVTQVLAQAASVEDGVAGILHAICHHFGWSVGLFWMVERPSDRARCIESWHNTDTRSVEFASDSRARTFRRGEGLPGRVWESGKPVWILDVVQDTNFPRAASAASRDLHGAFACPIVIDGETLGIIEFFSGEIREPDAELLELMDTLTGQIGQFIERKEAELQVRRSEQELSDFFENATIGLHWVGPDGVILRVNKAELDLLGYAQHEYVGQPIAKFHADQEVIDDILSRLHARETLHNYPAQMICKDGSIRDVLIDSSVMWRDGEFVHTRCFTRDVTEQKRAEGQIRFQAHVLDTVGQAAIVTDPGGAIIYWNRHAETLYGWSSGEALGRNLIKLIIAPEAASEAVEIMNRLQAGGSWLGELLARRRDGTHFPTFVTDTPILDAQGKLKAIIGISVDITDRKRTEQGLRFLADASVTLASLVDYQSTLQKIAGLAVPQFADWCAVDIVESDGSLRRLAVVHVDPAKVALAEEFHRRYPPDPAAVHGLAKVLRSGESDMMSDIPDAMLVQGAKDKEHLRLMQMLGFRSYMCVPLKGRGKLVGIITFVSAESERRYSNADLAFAEELARRAAIAIENTQMYTELRDADRRKDEFLATLAHELRNPLAPIRNSLQVLKMPRVDALIAQKSREMMERQVQHLVRLVDDLLDVSRVMRGKIEMRKEWVELASIVARAVETAQPLIEAQRHELAISLPAEPLLLDADPIRLAQVISNLLTNAAKYTEANGTIRLSAQREDDMVVLRVQDTGIGIAPDMLPHIFDLFVQADYAATRSQGGLGIGLTLVKSLVEMHKGTINARSDGLGKGSEFVVRLPLSAVKREQTNEKADAPTSPASHSGNRILVVDDNKDAADSLALLLRLQGHDVRTAHSGIEALETAATYQPGMIILDIGMPGMDGYEVARRLRQQPHLKNVLLAALTGWGQQEDRRRSAEAGFDYHLVKPPEPKTLENLLMELRARKTAN